MNVSKCGKKYIYIYEGIIHGKNINIHITSLVYLIYI